jgi:hypothetical protein
LHVVPFHDEELSAEPSPEWLHPQGEESSVSSIYLSDTLCLQTTRSFRIKIHKP